MTETEQRTLMVKYMRTGVTPDERHALVDAKLIRVTNKTFGHTAATAKGLKLIAADGGRTTRF